MNLGPDFYARAGQRWHQIDPLLPAPGLSAARGCGAELIVPGPDGEPATAGTCEHWEARPARAIR